MSNQENKEEKIIDKKEDVAIDDDIPKETLITLLKDKSREIRNQTSKLTKLEEKYVKIYKEHKLMSKDRDTFYKILSIIFGQEPYILPDKPMGDYQFQDLQDMWVKREEDKSKTLNAMMMEINNEKQEL